MSDTISEPRAGPSDHDAALLDVSVRRGGSSSWVVEVGGELDLLTAPMLKRHLPPSNDPSWTNGQPRRIIYLLSDLEFMDLRGLDALLTAFDGHGPETITIRQPSPVVRRLLELVDLDSMIDDGAIR